MMNPFSQLKKAKTLLVDDDELIRDSISTAFTTKGCFLKTAEQGLKALEEEKFDIVISDFRLPGIDGIRFLRLATLMQPDSIKLLITAYKDEHILSEALRYGISEFMEKPFQVKALLELLSLTLMRQEKFA